MLKAKPGAPPSMMILVGQFDSPFVRRVAATMGHYDIPFERHVLSVFGDRDEVLRLNPLGKVPALIIDDGEGMPSETLASLQNESFILDDARPRGPGMGMLITQEVARRAGWSVHYTQLTPKGLEVRLEGPVVSREAK